MSLLLYKIASELGLVVCEESEVQIVKAAGDLADGVHTDEINTKGATRLYMIRDARQVNPTTNVVQSAISGAVPLSNPANMVDKDEDTESSANFGSGQSPTIHRFDWGSIAVRHPAMIYEATVGASRDGRVEVRYSDDAVIWSAWTSALELDNSVNFPKAFVELLPSTSFRYIEIRFVTITTGGVDHIVYEVFDAAEGWGNSDLTVQIKDDARNDWKTIPDQPVFPTLSSFAETQVDVEVLIVTMPHKATGLFRTVITQIGKSNYSLVVVKVDPCKV